MINLLQKKSWSFSHNYIMFFKRSIFPPPLAVAYHNSRRSLYTYQCHQSTVGELNPEMCTCGATTQVAGNCSNLANFAVPFFQQKNGRRRSGARAFRNGCTSALGFTSRTSASSQRKAPWRLRNRSVLKGRLPLLL